MEYSLIEFNQGIENLNKYVNAITKNRNLYKKLKNTDIHSQEYRAVFQEAEETLKDFLDKDVRVFEYTSIVINLYGLLERFMEKSISEYIDFLVDNVPKYSNLPKELIENHYELSAHLINSLNLPKYKDMITKEKIVSNLYSCNKLQESTEYKINNEAFTQHSSNFRESSINEFFKKVGISNITASLKEKNSTLKQYMEEYEVDFKNELYILNDLVERRNRISHGSEENDILDLDELQRYISYVKVFTISLNDILMLKLAPHIVENENNVYELGVPLKKISDKTIGIRLSKITLEQGNKLIIKNEENEYKYGNIESIQLNDKSYVSLTLDEEVCDVGLRLNCKIKENDYLYAWR